MWTSAMTVQQDRLQSQLDQLQQQFSASLPTRMDRVVALLSGLHQRFDEARYQTLRTEVHQLAGSVTAFGYLRLGMQIGELNGEIKAGRSYFSSLSRERLEQLCTSLMESVQTR